MAKTPGSIWIDTADPSRLHYVDYSGTEYRFDGAAFTGNIRANTSIGRIWLETGDTPPKIHFIGNDCKEWRLDVTAWTGKTAPNGSIWVDGVAGSNTGWDYGRALSYIYNNIQYIMMHYDTPAANTYSDAWSNTNSNTADSSTHNTAGTDQVHYDVPGGAHDDTNGYNQHDDGWDGRYHVSEAEGHSDNYNYNDHAWAGHADSLVQHSDIIHTDHSDHSSNTHTDNPHGDTPTNLGK